MDPFLKQFVESGATILPKQSQPSYCRIACQYNSQSPRTNTQSLADDARVTKRKRTGEHASLMRLVRLAITTFLHSLLPIFTCSSVPDCPMLEAEAMHRYHLEIVTQQTRAACRRETKCENDSSSAVWASKSVMLINTLDGDATADGVVSNISHKPTRTTVKVA